jgi:hypothetical protein
MIRCTTRDRASNASRDESRVMCLRLRWIRSGLVLAVMLWLLPWAAGGSAQQRPGLFVDATAESGLDFIHLNGATGELLLPEVIGAGGALFDYDNDGDLDLFVVQGGPLRASGAPGPAARSRLYRNDLSDGRARFADVTARSGIVAAGYGMGATTGDYDKDGWIDLYVTFLGSNHLFRNNRDGTFSDVTTRSGTDDVRWSTSAAFLDYDRDGWLDLYVANYVTFSVETTRACFSAGSARDYCNPAVYQPATGTLFHNNRDGTFANVSARAGLSRAPARGLGVIAADFNGDGWPDLYVANDGDPNQLWLNERGTGAFKEDALLTGVAVSRDGRPQGSMGVDLGDVDGDGDEDLFVTNLDNEGNALYRNLGKGLYEERTIEAGLFALGLTGFGTRFVDYDNDGWLDLVVVNGAVRHVASQVQGGDPYPLKQRSQLFHNERGRRFDNVTDQAGPAFAPLLVSRGLAAGDLDNDGDVDLVVFNNNGPGRILLNTTSGRHWLGVRVVDGAARDVLDTQVVLRRPTGTLVRRTHVDGSYCAAGDPRVIFGLGTETTPQSVRVRWPGGRIEDFQGLSVDRYWVLEAGRPPRPM